MSRLYLLRHAKSSWDEPGLDDHDRPLAPRGRRAAKLVAGHLAAQGVEPALVLCSSSRRTLDTLDRIRPALGAEAEVLVEDDLYAASAGRLLARLRLVPDEIPSVLLIGHNPGLQDLAVILAGHGHGLERLGTKFPTAALATLEVPGAWSELEPGSTALLGYVVPRDLA